MWLDFLFICSAMISIVPQEKKKIFSENSIVFGFTERHFCLSFVTLLNIFWSHTNISNGLCVCASEFEFEKRKKIFSENLIAIGFTVRFFLLSFVTFSKIFTQIQTNIVSLTYIVQTLSYMYIYIR